MICVLHFAISLPTDTVVPLSYGENGLLTGEYSTEKLNIERNFVLDMRKEYQNCDKL